MCGLHRSMTEIPSGIWAPKKSEHKSRLPFVLLPGAMDLTTRGSLQDQQLMLILGLWDFEPSGGTAAKINGALLILRSMVHDFFGSSGFISSTFLHTSHFKTLEAYFLEHWDQLPPVHFKIDNSRSLQALGLRTFCSSSILRAILDSWKHMSH